MTLPLVSIGVPTYNRAALLGQTLDMITAQDYPNLEVVISDNHSEDDTEVIARAAVARDPRMRYVRQPDNIGLHRNLNFCLGQARGEFVCLFMDDDQYRPTIVREYVEFFTTHPEVGLVCSDWEIIDSDGQMIDVREHRVPPVMAGLDYIGRTIRSGRSAVGCPGMMVRRQALDGARFDDDGPIGFGDFVVWCRIAERWAIGHVARKLWRFRVHDKALSSRPVHAIVRDFETNVVQYCAGHLERWPAGGPRVARWKRAMRRYIFWALVYEVALEARRAAAHREPSGRHRTVFEIAGRRLTPQERQRTIDLLRLYQTGLDQRIALAAFSTMLRLHVTTPLAWVSRYPESIRAVFRWR